MCDEFYGWPTETPLVRFDGVFFRRIFGQVREVMDFSFGGVSFETGDTSFGYGATLVRGIGIYHEQYYDSPFFQLYGAIINGVQYGTIVSVDQIAAPLPGQVALQQNFPNPFNPTTTIRYELPEHLRAKLSIYNVLGQEITTLVDELQAGGRYEVLFSGGGLPSGLYVCVLYAGEFRASRRILLIK